jgi:ankyrin repeat protein
MGKTKINAKECVKAIRAGLDDAELMDQFALSSRELLNLFGKLVKAGLIEQSELDARVPYYERTVEISFQFPNLDDDDDDDTGPAAMAGFKHATMATPFSRPAENNRPGEDPIVEAAKRGSLDEVDQCLRTGSPVEARGAWGMAPLTWACAKGHLKVAEFLLKKGADVNARTGNGSTALMWAAFGGHKSIVELLLARGADINARSKVGKTALIGAAHSGWIEVVKLLMTKGCALETKDSSGKTALDYAREAGHQETVRFLSNSYKTKKAVTGR